MGGGKYGNKNVGKGSWKGLGKRNGRVKERIETGKAG